MNGLPCGRVLSYPRAQVKDVLNKFDVMAPVITFQHPTFGESSMWGGGAAENVTQGLAASVLRGALVRLRGAAIELHTHDEIVVSVPDTPKAVDAGTALLEREMLHVPDWAQGLPLGCEIESGYRYKIPACADHA